MHVCFRNRGSFRRDAACVGTQRCQNSHTRRLFVRRLLMKNMNVNIILEIRHRRNTSTCLIAT